MSSVAKPANAPGVEARSESVALPWVSFGWFAALLVLCYAPVLAKLVRQWNEDEDMGHGFFVPVIAGYIAWQKREELFAGPLRSNPLGLVLVLLGAVQLYIGTLGAELFLSRTAILETLVGMVLFLGGWHALKVLAFPLFLLIFMVPIPSIIYNQITFPLQLFASRVAAVALETIGIPVLRDGNVLELASQKLSVVEACSGIRSLLSLSFLSLVYAWFFDSRPWMRAVLLVATVPIAIVANAGRVTITGILSEINPELAHGLAHTASGWVIFMIALVMLVLTHQVISRSIRVFNGHAEA
jgi:exosortase